MKFLTGDTGEVADAARAASRIALDTEFMREKTYRARLCLVQVATDDELWLIDPADGGDVESIAKVLPEIEVVLHAGKQDLEIFFDRYGVTPARVFDVQIAAAFAGFGSSLPYGRLVESVLGTKLKKGESYTDWCRRPLTDEQLDYAADDVRYLLPAARRISERLDQLGRSSWAEEELAVLAEPDTYDIDPAAAYLRVTGRGSLSGTQLAVLRELASWREQAAARRDLPRNWIVKDVTLVELARRGPSNMKALKIVRGLSPGEAERSGAELLEVIARGKESGPIAGASGAPRGAQVRARAIVGLADAIVRARCDRAEIATEIVTTRGELEGLLADVFAGRLNPGSHRLMEGWRRDLVGDALVALAEGRVGIKTTDSAPYIEEVQLRS